MSARLNNPKLVRAFIELFEFNFVRKTPNQKMMPSIPPRGATRIRLRQLAIVEGKGGRLDTMRQAIYLPFSGQRKLQSPPLNPDMDRLNDQWPTAALNAGPLFKRLEEIKSKGNWTFLRRGREASPVLVHDRQSYQVHSQS